MSKANQFLFCFNRRNNERFNNVLVDGANSVLRSTENNELLLPIHRLSTAYG